MSYRIGSFNTLRMDFTSTEKRAINFDMIAQIIKSAHLDIVALQEVLNENVIKDKLIPALGHDWKYTCKESGKFYSKTKEMFVFLWNSQRLDLIKEDAEGNFVNKFEIKNNLLDGAIVRPPYVARFTPNGKFGGAFFEIRLINVHIVYGKPQAGISVFSSDRDIRMQELNIIAKQIYPRVADKRYGTNMPAYTFILGDYNLVLQGPGEKMDNPIIIGDNRLLKTVQKEKSTIKSKEEDLVLFDEIKKYIRAQLGLPDTWDYYSKNYDHFSYETTYEDKMKLTVSRSNALKHYYHNDIESYRKEIFDHIPIIMDISLMK